MLNRKHRSSCTLIKPLRHALDIENRIIASAYPSSGLEGLYRNASDEVKRYTSICSPCFDLRITNGSIGF